MASPPFGLATTAPADTDFVSQFPSNERTNRDVIQSWIEVNHDTNGDHVVMTMPFQSSAPATPASNTQTMYTDVNGNLVIIKPDGNLYYVGVTPGSISFTAGATADNGYALANGQAISRSGVGAALFARIGTTYGVGDGSTTFNVPDITGRSISGKEATATRLTTTNSGVDGGTMGATGGSPNFTLAQSDLPNVALTFSGISSPLVLDSNNAAANTGGSGTPGPFTQPLNGEAAATITGHVVPQGTISSMNGNVTQTATKTQPTTIIQLAQIKL